MDPTYDPTTIDPEPTTTAPEKKCEPMKEVCDSYLNIARRIIYVILIISKNPLGTCDCEPQLHYGRDCRSAFYCMTDDMFEDGNPEGNVGCHMTCPEGKFLVPDPR